MVPMVVVTFKKYRGRVTSLILRIMVQYQNTELLLGHQLTFPRLYSYLFILFIYLFGGGGGGDGKLAIRLC